MNYQIIHDKIINRASNRILHQEVYQEKHHIIPKCEGGDIKGITVKLTLKEHRLIHKLRYKITKIFGNIAAFNYMTQGVEAKRKNNIAAAKLSHKKMKEKDLDNYILRQKKAGICGGVKARDEKIGFFKYNEDEMKIFRDKGRNILVENKIGMFSDSYRIKHKKMLQKKIFTPNGDFDSMTEASLYFNVSRGTITYRVNNNNWLEWGYLI